jgi:hypothetical protein
MDRSTGQRRTRPVPNRDRVNRRLFLFPAAIYKELESAGKLTNVYFDPNSESTWVYNGTTSGALETAQSLAFKRQYIKDKGLAGIMMYSLEADDPSRPCSTRPPASSRGVVDRRMTAGYIPFTRPFPIGSGLAVW